MVTLEDSRPTNGSGLDSAPVEMEAPIQTGMNGGNGPTLNPEAVHNVLYSDVGIGVLLGRLKQSIASVRDFSGFLAKRARLEDEHAKGLEKLSRATNDLIRRPEGRQGSYASHMVDVFRAHDRMAEHGNQFSLSLNQMHQDLDKLAMTTEQGRKYWKQEGTANEKKVKDAESAHDKAKSKYDSLADDYDKARTGGGNSGRVFTVKGPKSAEKHEEDLHRKLQAADSDYATKVQAAQTARQDNLKSMRPQAVKALQELIAECDSALALQIQKFAAFNEKLVVGTGLEISPMRSAGLEGSQNLSMRETLQQIDNERDFHSFVTAHSSSVPPTAAEIKYIKHPTLAPAITSTPAASQVPPQQSSSATASNQRQSLPMSSAPAPTLAAASTSPALMNKPFPPNPQTVPQQQSQQQQPPPQQQQQQIIQGPAPPYLQEQPQLSTANQSGPMAQGTPGNNAQLPYPSSSPNMTMSQPRQASSDSGFRNISASQPRAPQAPIASGAPRPMNGYPQGPPGASQRERSPHQAALSSSPRTNGSYNQPRLPALRPVFGQNLEALFRRDDTAIPLVVYQCIQAVDLFGLDVEGIYRLSGNANHIGQLKAVFDNDSSRVDFRNPEAFFHDINSVAGLLKQFFRELPDPLFTSEHYNRFIDAAKIDDDDVRRDSVHAVINELPDPNYATLRAIILHLHRVGEHAQNNRMSTHNLAICFAPTLMGQHSGPQMSDAGLQARVVDTILRNTYQIFDED